MRLKTTWILCLALGLAAFSSAPLCAGPTSSNPFGLGLSLGGGSLGDISNVSLSGKYWYDADHALDMGLGGDGAGVNVNADYLWHNYHVFDRNWIPLYYGVGGYLNAGSYFGAGVQGKIGVDWLFRRTPWEVYVELVPALNVLGGVGFGVGADVGGRFYFF